MDELLAQIESRLGTYLDRPYWLLGFSGGLDSTVLLHLLHDYLQEQESSARPVLEAVHVHHGLSPAADGWQEHCQASCDALGVGLKVLSVDVDANHKGGPEAAAREARYRGIDALRRPDDVLFLAHHLDDQIETLLLNLFRSRGVAGLAAMSMVAQRPAGTWLRPLLEIQRSEIHLFAQRRALSWVEDDSNSDERLSRNFVRRRLLPTAEVHWPDYRERLATLNKLALSESQLLAEIAAEDMALVASVDRWGLRLDVEVLAAMSEARVRNLLTAWLHRAGCASLRQRQWPEFFERFLSAGSGSMEVRGGLLRRYRQSIYLDCYGDGAEPFVPPQSTLNSSGVTALQDGSVFELEAAQGRGLVAANAYNLRFRCGGERVQQGAEGRSKPLNQYLQEQRVPPWWRDKVPLVFHGPELAAVADFCIMPSFAAAPGQASLIPRWETATSAAAG